MAYTAVDMFVVPDMFSLEFLLLDFYFGKFPPLKIGRDFQPPPPQPPHHSAIIDFYSRYYIAISNVQQTPTVTAWNTKLPHFLHET